MTIKSILTAFPLVVIIAALPSAAFAQRQEFPPHDGITVSQDDVTIPPLACTPGYWSVSKGWVPPDCG